MGDVETLKWVQAFLSQFEQKVVINVSSSKMVKVTSGVPHGRQCPDK